MEVIEDYLTGPDLCRRLSLHRNTVSAMLRRGEFPNAFRMGREWRIPKSDIAAWIERQKEATHAA